MDSSAVLQSFRCSFSHMESLVEKTGRLPIHNANLPTSVGGKNISFPMKRNVALVSCLKTSEVAAIPKSDVSSDGAMQGSLKKAALRNATFPNGFEALIEEVCDETEVAELKLKIGDFQMHLKRNIEATEAPVPNIRHTESPPVPTKPMDVSAPVAPTPPPKPSSEKVSPFTNVSYGRSTKLAALEASGSSGYVIVASNLVGTFLRNRKAKGKTLPPPFKEGDLIKEGQVIGYVQQFGTIYPVKSDVAGEVLKVLVNDGDAIGYGDPILAVFPSFHDINV